MGPQGIQRSRAKGLLAGVNATAQGSLSIPCVDLVCDTNRGDTLHKIFVLYCTSLQ